MFCAALCFYSFVLFCFFVFFAYTEYFGLYLRYGSVPFADWEVSSSLMSCFLMLDNVPVENFSTPVRLTFNTSVSTGPLSSLSAVYLPYILTWKCYRYTTRNTLGFQGMLLRYPTRSCFLNKIRNSFTASVIPYTHAFHAFFLRGSSKLIVKIGRASCRERV